MVLLESSFLDPLYKRWDRQVTLSEDDKQAVAELPWARRSFARDSYLVREGEPASVCTLLINGFACPMIYVSATQLSAIVPYEVAPPVF